MPITIQIDSVEDGTKPTASVNTPPPWTVTYTLGGVGGIGNVSALAYQIDEGPVTGIDLPPDINQNNFQLTNGDLPAAGLYLLTLMAWEDTNDSVSDNINIQLILNQQPISVGCSTDGGAL